MRYIGSKNNMLHNIQNIISSLDISHTKKKLPILCDIFAGTGAVGIHFKKDFQIISNDLLRFSFLLQSIKIGLNEKPKFINLKKIGINDPISHLNQINIDCFDEIDNQFFAKNYSPYGSERQYFTINNAKKIDLILYEIEKFSLQGLINETEKNYLMCSLIEAVPFISNIAGTFGAYLKHWDKRAFKELNLQDVEIQSNGQTNKCYNQDANDLVTQINGDVLYLDPPYNSRQYLPYYHVLETIARNDRPQIYGKTGMRPYKNETSDYCIKSSVLKTLDDIINKANFKYIVMSYSSEGLLTKDQIEEVSLKYALKGSYVFNDFPYRRYKSNTTENNPLLHEYIFVFQRR